LDENGFMQKELRRKKIGEENRDLLGRKGM
jgi:hypothetical protein